VPRKRSTEELREWPRLVGFARVVECWNEVVVDVVVVADRECEDRLGQITGKLIRTLEESW